MVNALSKASMRQSLCQNFGLNKPDAKLLVELFFDEIRNALIEGKHVKLSGFGNYVLRDKSARPGRNPRTGEEVVVNARRVVTFKPGLKLKVKIDSQIKD